MKTKLIASLALVTSITLGVSQAILAAPPDPDDKAGKPFQSCNLNEGDVTVQRCLMELKEVQDVIDDALSLNDREYASLTSKVCLANDKLNLEKWDDAAQKLTDVASTVNSKRKVDPADAAAISAAATAAASDIVNFTCDLDLAP